MRCTYRRPSLQKHDNAADADDDDGRALLHYSSHYQYYDVQFTAYTGCSLSLIMYAGLLTP